MSYNAATWYAEADCSVEERKCWFNVSVNAAGQPTNQGEYGLADHYAAITMVEDVAKKVFGNARDIDIGWLVICGEWGGCNKLR
jgi:hypothetical protein